MSALPLVDSSAATEFAVTCGFSEAIAVIAQSSPAVARENDPQERKHCAALVALTVLTKALGRMDDDPDHPRTVKEVLDVLRDMQTVVA